MQPNHESSVDVCVSESFSGFIFCCIQCYFLKEFYKYITNAISSKCWINILPMLFPQRSINKLLHSLKPTIKCTLEVEVNIALPFLDILIMKRVSNLATKATRIGRYLQFKSDHPYHVKRGVVHTLAGRAKVTCQDRKDFNRESKIRSDI
jgi:hypothetical protein